MRFEDHKKCNLPAVRGLEDSLGSPNAAPHGSDEDDEEYAPSATAARCAFVIARSRYLQDDVSPPELPSPASRPSTSRGLNSRDRSSALEQTVPLKSSPLSVFDNAGGAGKAGRESESRQVAFALNVQPRLSRCF